MTPIRVGSRLEQLQGLERRTKQEIDLACFHQTYDRLPRLRELLARVQGEIVAEGGQPTHVPKGQPKTKRKKAEDKVYARLGQLGVTAHEVKVWAVSVGLLDQVRRGRIRGELVEAYASNHHPISQEPQAS